MPSRSTLVSHARSLLGMGLMGLGALWLVRLIWPMLALVGLLAGLGIAIGAGSYRLWHYQQHRYEAQIRYEDRLARQFYALLEHREGRISALEFAMHTRIAAPRAQRYLHEQAQAFGAYFERTVRGDIIYIFNLGMIFGVSSPQASTEMTPAEVAWTYAEQMQLARLRAQKKAAIAQRAWEVVRQLKALKGQALQSENPAQPQLEQTLPTVRGRAQATPEAAKTIDVSALSE